MGYLELLKLLGYASNPFIMLSLKDKICLGGRVALDKDQKQGFRRDLLLIATECSCAAAF